VIFVQTMMQRSDKDGSSLLRCRFVARTYRQMVSTLGGSLGQHFMMVRDDDASLLTLWSFSLYDPAIFWKSLFCCCCVDDGIDALFFVLLARAFRAQRVP
jgi:hypothetical protein